MVFVVCTFFRICPIILRWWHVKNVNNFQIAKVRSSHPEVFCQKGVLKNFAKFTGKHLCQSLSLIKLHCRSEAYNFIKKGTLAQLFSYEFCKISKNIFHYRIPLVSAFGKFSLRVLLSFCLFFCQFQPAVVYKSVIF